MPARLPVPNVVQIVLFQKYGEDLDVVNRYFQKYSGSPGSLDDTQAAVWAHAVTSAWTAHLAGHIVSTLSLVKVTVTDLTSDVGAFGEDDTGSVGTLTPPGVPAGVALVVKSHIERRYRGGHPRQYLAGMPEANLADPNTWASGTVSGVATDYTAFRAADSSGITSGLTPVTDVNVSYFTGFTNHTFPSGRVRPIPNPRGTPLVDQIASFAVNPKVASQRRRNLQSL